ncbi:TlpA disulfide reductase family protein [Rapidithrix thailandica]|uniref:TlpA disulfide reductase family protein n=1 Tax=Rapidithrix thailandica TaxID=413964 RepID=A0AAW9S0D8_9BACT
MKKFLFLFILGFICWNSTLAQPEVKVIKMEQLEAMINHTSGKTYVINFWATWCAPCIKELPDFEKARDTFKSKNVEFILVSLDFANQLESRVIPFVKRKNLKSRVVLLDETDYDTWIGRIDPDWEGAIPATLVVNSQSQQRKFFPKGLTYDDLVKILQSFI